MTLRRIGHVDVTPLLSYLPGVVWPPSNGDCTMLQTRAVIENFLPARDLDALINNVMTTPNLRHHHVGTVFLSKVKAAGRIRLHNDDVGGRLRIHVPLQTNIGALFFYDGEAHHLDLGVAYELDPFVSHRIENFGIRDRIHLFWEIW